MIRILSATPAPPPAQPLPQPPPDIQNRPQQPAPGQEPAKPNGAEGNDESVELPKPTVQQTPKGGLHLPFEKPTTVSITRSWQEPIYDRTLLGSIPEDYFQWTWGWGGWGGGASTYHPIGGPNNNYGPVAVYRDVPRQNPDGTPQMQPTTQTLTATTYDQKARSMWGGVLGAGVGVGAAALTGLAAGGSVGGPIGMLVGGVAGLAAGAAIGFTTAKGDTLKEQWQTASVNTPTFEGYQEYLQPQYHYNQVCHPETHRDPDGNLETTQECESIPVLDGYWHQFSPQIAWTSIGSYKYPTLQHTDPISTAGGLALGVGAAAALGVGAAFLATVL
ncbi:MAG: hypothetical protein ACYCW6_05710 [Candidatus Xenobia bacterium]